MKDPLPSVAAAIEAVDEELRAHNAGHSHLSNTRQLAKFREILESMQLQIKSDAAPPRAQRLTGMGRMIADSWPFDSELAALILEAERRYLRL